MPRPCAIIAEDEPLLRDELAELLAALWPELEVVAQTGDGIATLRALERHAPDVLFLDIEMPGLTGLEVARQTNGRCIAQLYSQGARLSIECEAGPRRAVLEIPLPQPSETQRGHAA